MKILTDADISRMKLTYYTFILFSIIISTIIGYSAGSNNQSDKIGEMLDTAARTTQRIDYGTKFYTILPYTKPALQEHTIIDVKNGEIIQDSKQIIISQAPPPNYSNLSKGTGRKVGKTTYISP